ncbi:MAG: molybdopterin-guanine dinucleotide biosynthesis protein B [Rhizobiaceae bacterium]
MNNPKIFGVTGWKNSGKTTMICKLIEEFVKRGYKVASVKHAHHNFDVDHEGTDSHSHRMAGAGEVAVTSSKRWAIMHELADSDEPTLAEMLEKLSPCDIILIEGYKKEFHPKIETIRMEFRRDKAIWKEDESVVAIATDASEPDCQLPQFSQEAITDIADMIADTVKLGKSNVRN